MFNFIFTSSRGPIIIKHGGGGWRTLEDHMISRGKGKGNQSLPTKVKRGGGLGNCRNSLPILRLLMSGDRKNITEP